MAGHEWKHGWIPLTSAAAREKFHGELPKNWHHSVTNDQFRGMLKRGGKSQDDKVMSHPALAKMDEADRHVIVHHLQQAQIHAVAGRHTEAEYHLNSAHNRAVRVKANGLAEDIQKRKEFQKEQATSFLPKLDSAGTARYNAGLRRVTGKTKPRVVPSQKQPPFGFKGAS